MKRSIFFWIGVKVEKYPANILAHSHSRVPGQNWTKESGKRQPPTHDLWVTLCMRPPFLKSVFSDSKIDFFFHFCWPDWSVLSGGKVLKGVIQNLVWVCFSLPFLCLFIEKCPSLHCPKSQGFSLGWSENVFHFKETHFSPLTKPCCSSLVCLPSMSPLAQGVSLSHVSTFLLAWNNSLGLGKRGNMSCLSLIALKM